VIPNSHLLLDLHHIRAADLQADAAHARLVGALKRQPTTTDDDRMPRPATVVRWWQRRRAALS